MRIKACRLCHSEDLTTLFSLGNQYVSDFVEATWSKGVEIPIVLVLCRSCTLVQLQHTAPQDFLYTRHYWYRSGITATMRAELADIARYVENLVSLGLGDIVCDIGSNDGTLLRSYRGLLQSGSPGPVRVGVEPANNLVQDGSSGVDVFIHDFWSKGAYYSRLNQKAKVITAIGMFYDLDDPGKFIEDVAACLHKDGVFVAQLMCLRNMLNINDVGNLCHEHLEFYSLKSLEYMFSKHGLEMIDISTNATNGESYRIVCRSVGGSVQPFAGAEGRLDTAWSAEQGLDSPGYYYDFFQRMEDNKDKVVSFVKREVVRGKKVWVYGASTKGNVILQYYGLDHSLIEGAADRSPEKWGKHTVGTRIPIYSEEDARARNPDYFLVLPYAFIREFVAREKKWIAGGGTFIVPLPEFKLVPQ